MEGNKKKKFLKALPFIILVLLVGLICFEYINHATTDVGNVNRYPTGDGGGVGIGNIDGLSEIISYLIGLFIKEPMVGLILLAVFVVLWLMFKKKQQQQASDTGYINQQVNYQAENDIVMDYTSVVAEKVRAIDPDFSSDKFIGYAREVFMKIQEAWTNKDWRPIRPFESEALFAQHKQQLDEFIRSGKTNVVEKINIKHCSLRSFREDGDKEVLVVWLNAIMRDYVIDDNTKKVLESDPNRDWYMRYEMVFNRKAGLKTDPGKKGNNITNCPNCGAPTEITSAGQCAYCGSVITTGEHDWVLTDIHSRK